MRRALIAMLVALGVFLTGCGGVEQGIAAPDSHANWGKNPYLTALPRQDACELLGTRMNTWFSFPPGRTVRKTPWPIPGRTCTLIGADPASGVSIRFDLILRRTAQEAETDFNIDLQSGNATTTYTKEQIPGADKAFRAVVVDMRCDGGLFGNAAVVLCADKKSIDQNQLNVIHDTVVDTIHAVRAANDSANAGDRKFDPVIPVANFPVSAPRITHPVDGSLLFGREGLCRMLDPDQLDALPGRRAGLWHLDPDTSYTDLCSWGDAPEVNATGLGSSIILSQDPNATQGMTTVYQRNNWQPGAKLAKLDIAGYPAMQVEQLPDTCEMYVGVNDTTVFDLNFSSEDPSIRCSNAKIAASEVLAYLKAPT